MPGLPLNHLLGPLENLSFVAALLHHLYCITNGPEGVAQLVAEHRQELIATPGCLCQFGGMFAQVVFEKLTFAEIADDLHEAAQPAVFVFERCTRTTGPKATPIPAQNPVFIL